VNFTLGAMQRMSAEAHVISQRASLPPLEGQHACQELSKVLLKLRAKGSVVKLDRPKLDPLAVWAKFVSARYALGPLDGLEFRTLCCAEETALRPTLVAALVKEPERLKRTRCLYGLVNAYFAHWRTMKDPNVVEGLLISALSNCTAGNLVVRKWLASKSLFSDKAASFLAEEICSRQKLVDEVLRDHNVSPLTKLGVSARDLAATVACENLRKVESTRKDDWTLKCLTWITGKVLSDLTSPDAFYAAISSLILSESAKRSETFQRALRYYIQAHKRLGDPRIRTSSPNWNTVSAAAARQYLSWLARDSIIFFFNTILPNNSENQRRKDFWLRYHDRIRDFQVAVSEQDLWKVKANQKSSDFLCFSKVDHPTTSAFLMKFEGYGGQFLVAEFSETGNAAYIFRYSDFHATNVNMRTPQFDLKRHLKFDKTNRIIHMGAWEPKTAYTLASQFGIRP
jgi:hypothetical protein